MEYVNEEIKDLDFERTFVILMNIFIKDSAYIEDGYVYWLPLETNIHARVYLFIAKTKIRLC